MIDSIKYKQTLLVVKIYINSIIFTASSCDEKCVCNCMEDMH